MTLVQIFVVLAVIAVVGAVAAGAVRGGLPEPESTVPDAGLSEGTLQADDVSQVRFALAFRGYRMDQVDEVLDRLCAELSERDAEIARLKEQ
ncbi:DivIVA domain-containing protein [Angustibacter sp. McL0619]|uniref:DivIVA domain-containing protein n=1 Tax=Angustibacter sp. McL0619 TaxID=3415676 RepID=UPI003CE72570